MANTHFTCPHCKGEIKLIPIGHTPTHMRRRTQFEHATQFTPTGKFKSFIWFLRGRPAILPPEIPRPNDMTLQIETWNHTEKQAQFHHLDKRITVGLVRDIARMVIELEIDWTRENLVRHTALSENRCRVVVSEFKRLGYLDVTENNRSTVTSQGRRFLRGVLAIRY